MCWLVWVVGFAWHGYVVVVLVIVVVVVLVVVVGVVVVAVALVFNSRQRQISSSRQDVKKNAEYSNYGYFIGLWLFGEPSEPFSFPFH